MDENESKGKEQREPEAQAAEGAEDAQHADDVKDTDDVKDSHGQPGINKERHDKEVAQLQAEIEALKAQAAEAAENKAKREEYERKCSDLERRMAESEVGHRLEMAGCLNAKAARALLPDYGDDVDKLKGACPYLFGSEKKTGTTGVKPGGAPDGLDEKLDRAFGLKK